MTTDTYEKTGIPGENELLFTALGGLGKIGSNFYAYGHKGKWLVVDFGLGFAGDSIPGVDIVLPDPAFLEERKKDIVGLVITHAHEDHVGALPYLYGRLDCPIFATPFTANVVGYKLSDGGFNAESVINVIPTGSHFTVGPFELEYVQMTHSIPEPQGLMIRTANSNLKPLFHTGDWKIDDTPMVGHNVDFDRLEVIGKDGVMAIVGDSTNVTSSGFSASEADVRQGLIDTISKLSGGVAVTCFASNVARMESIAMAAKASNRKVVLAGRSLWRMVDCAQQAGYLTECPEFHEPEDVKEYDKEELLFICTGSQGEPRAALARIASGRHRDVRFDERDTVLFSARAIPGNEKSIASIQNMLVDDGVHIITASDAPIHASGHGAREEMEKLYDVLKPVHAVPMHGEALHMKRHAQLATDKGVPNVHILQNGQMISFTADGAKVVDEVTTGEFAMDGGRFTATDSSAVKQRRKMAFAGLIVIAIAMDSDGNILGNPSITAEGVPLSNEKEYKELIKVVERSIDKMSDEDVREDSQVKDAIQRQLRRKLKNITDKRSHIKIQIIRV